MMSWVHMESQKEAMERMRLEKTSYYLSWRRSTTLLFFDLQSRGNVMIQASGGGAKL